MDLAITRTFTNFVVIFRLQKSFPTDQVCFYRTGQNYFLLQKGLLTLRGYGFFFSENHVVEEILKYFFANIYYFE